MSAYFIMVHKYVNGPIMPTRLEGIVNNIKKVIYLFGDLHLDLYEQSKCPRTKKYIKLYKY